MNAEAADAYLQALNRCTLADMASMNARSVVTLADVKSLLAEPKRNWTAVSQGSSCVIIEFPEPRI